jgi:catechol 2,3-dioxygenase-like lactoylglutathione lyase family enzyme
MVRRYAPFVLLTALGCSSQGAAPPLPAAEAQPAAPAAAQPQQPAQQPALAADSGAPISQPTTPPTPSTPPDAGSAPAVPNTPTTPAPTPDAGQPAQQPPAADAACEPRKLEGPSGVFFHHIHFNSSDPDADLDFYEKYLAATSIDFCTRPGAAPATRATRTERGYFLFTRVAAPPDPALNAYLEHIGWCHPDPVGELQRQAMLGAPLWPSNPGRGQCDTAAMGTRPCNDYWFYLQAPNGARVEIALGPGPATMGFGHIHMIMGEDLAWYQTITGGRYANTAIDTVNITDVLEDEAYLDGEMVTDTRGKPIDHIGFSTSDLTAERERLVAAGIDIAEDISFKPEYGFRSFFMKSAKGVWVEMVEDTAFAP